jgi:hypothetical protein
VLSVRIGKRGGHTLLALGGGFANPLQGQGYGAREERIEQGNRHRVIPKRQGKTRREDPHVKGTCGAPAKPRGLSTETVGTTYLYETCRSWNEVERYLSSKLTVTTVWVSMGTPPSVAGR